MAADKLNFGGVVLNLCCVKEQRFHQKLNGSDVSGAAGELENIWFLVQQAAVQKSRGRYVFI